MASSASRVAIIFGTGPRIGASLVKGFLGAGYRVATVSRSGSGSGSGSGPSGDSSPNPFHIQADLTDPSAAVGAFAKVTQTAGWPFPSVVVWNASSMTAPDESDPKNPLAIDGAGFDRDLTFMIKSPYVAAGEAVKAWREKGEGVARKGTFIMTGNMGPRRVFPVPVMTTLGIGKAGANYWMGVADAMFKEEGIRHGVARLDHHTRLVVFTYLSVFGPRALANVDWGFARFYFADERGPDGGPAWLKNLSGESHAKLYLDLVEGKQDPPYYVTFRNGKYEKIDNVD
ncbi:hypothetical protein VMCG_06490 [Cytospora schulzeri]|uniref:NAD-dependent epimerase/dehydratase domain-containing protein n=1 Tax=Cytospora schulzeri TaxID=448051 RepID=A0A423WBS4_9PEZI|nr:hypothetical protein VMCG_06490 [Valsa malicola]